MKTPNIIHFEQFVKINLASHKKKLEGQFSVGPTYLNEIKNILVLSTFVQRVTFGNTLFSERLLNCNFWFKASGEKLGVSI